MHMCHGTPVKVRELVVGSALPLTGTKQRHQKKKKKDDS